MHLRAFQLVKIINKRGLLIQISFLGPLKSYRFLGVFEHKKDTLAPFCSGELLKYTVNVGQQRFRKMLVNLLFRYKKHTNHAENVFTFLVLKLLCDSFQKTCNKFKHLLIYTSIPWLKLQSTTMIYTLSFLTYYWYLQQVQLKNGLINVLEQQDVSLQKIKETVTKLSLTTKGLSSSRISRQMGKIVIIQNVTSGQSKLPFLLHSIISIVPLYFCTLLKYSL